MDDDLKKRGESPTEERLLRADDLSLAYEGDDFNTQADEHPDRPLRVRGGGCMHPFKDTLAYAALRWATCASNNIPPCLL